MHRISVAVLAHADVQGPRRGHAVRRRVKSVCCCRHSRTIRCRFLVSAVAYIRATGRLTAEEDQERSASAGMRGAGCGRCALRGNHARQGHGARRPRRTPNAAGPRFKAATQIRGRRVPIGSLILKLAPLLSSTTLSGTPCSLLSYHHVCTTRAGLQHERSLPELRNTRGTTPLVVDCVVITLKDASRSSRS